jgi:hypothetical protein
MDVIVLMIKKLFNEIEKHKNDFRSVDLLPMNLNYHLICLEEDLISSDMRLNSDEIKKKRQTIEKIKGVIR